LFIYSIHQAVIFVVTGLTLPTKRAVKGITSGVSEIAKASKQIAAILILFFLPFDTSC